jgi:hypothetical protein
MASMSQIPKVLNPELSSGVQNKLPPEAVFHIDLKEVPEHLMEKVQAAIVQSRTSIIGLLEEDGQYLLPNMGPENEISIPASKVAAFTEGVLDKLNGRGDIGIKLEVDEQKKLIKAISDYHQEDPHEAIGYTK